MSRRIALALLFTGAGCVACGSGGSAGSEGGGGAGSVGSQSPGVDLAHEYDVLVEEAQALSCKVCPCGGFNPSSSEGEACTGAVLDQYPDAKQQMLCKLEDLRTYAGCLRQVHDCAAARRCDDAKRVSDGQCPTVDDASPRPLPPACANVMQ